MYCPVILLGNGVRNNPALIEHLCSLNIPVLTTWMACDFVPEHHPAFCGRPGIFGQRAANIIQQKATNLFCFGARLDGEQVAYDYQNFAPNAQKHIYDVDRAEWAKFPHDWLMMDNPMDGPITIESNPEWLTWCRGLYDRFRPELDGKHDEVFVDPFTFIRLLGEFSLSDDVFALGSSGNAPTTFFQTYKVKQGQRITNVSTIGAMGADIPMALGAALAYGKRTICVTGDGGFHMNTQELETIRRLKLPIIFFVMNNNGYNSIRVAQKGRFGRLTGADPSSGLTLPSLELIAEAYKFLYVPLWSKDLPKFSRCFDLQPMIVEVFVDPEWGQLPRVMTSVQNGVLITDPMEDMTPKIDDLQGLMNE